MKLKGLLIRIFTLLLVTACSSSISYPERSTVELSQAGYYSYAFPSTYEAQFKWTKTIKLWSFDKQCSGFFSEDRWNPIYVVYTQDHVDSFEIRISPQDALWDMAKPNRTINLDAEWIPSHQGESHLTGDNTTIIKIKDSFGMDVIISSKLPPETLSELIKQIQYTGPDPTTVSNPWQSACK